MLDRLLIRVLGTIVILVGGIDMIAFGMTENGSNYRGNLVWDLIAPFLHLQWIVLEILMYLGGAAAVGFLIYLGVLIYQSILDGIEEKRIEKERTKRFEEDRQKRLEEEKILAKEREEKAAKEAEEKRARERERAHLAAKPKPKPDAEELKKRAIEQITRGY